MQISISQIVSKLGAEILNAPSDEISINGLASLAEAKQEDLSFFHHERYLNDLKSTKAGAVLVPSEFKETIDHVPLLNVKSPSLAFNEIAKDHGLISSGFRIVTNNGKDANQEVPHFHIHILGGENLKGIK